MIGRRDISDYFKSTKSLVAVEVGVHQAVFASEFILKWEGHLHLVDPWKDKCDTHPTFYPSFDEETETREDDYQIALKTMEPYKNRVTFHRMSSEEASRILPSVDLVYIDGLHDYENVSRDIALWFPKVLPGGLLCGHDYAWDHPDVVRAVDEFAAKHSLTINLTEEDLSSWIIAL